MAKYLEAEIEELLKRLFKLLVSIPYVKGMNQYWRLTGLAVCLLEVSQSDLVIAKSSMHLMKLFVDGPSDGKWSSTRHQEMEFSSKTPLPPALEMRHFPKEIRK